MANSLEEKKKILIDILESRKHWAVAYSGGMDSSLLLWFIVTKTSSMATPFFIDHEMLPTEVLESVKRFEGFLKEKAGLNLNVSIMRLSLLSIEQIRRNRQDRCYHCKYRIFTTIRENMLKYGCDALCDGSLSDDASWNRPGVRALKEVGGVSPLKVAGFTKKEVIEIVTKEMPFSCDLWFRYESCLATRLPYGYSIDPELLKKIDAIEKLLKASVPGPIRARYDSGCNTIRLEIQPCYFTAFFKTVDIYNVVAFVRELGFSNVVLDLLGHDMD